MYLEKQADYINTQKSGKFITDLMKSTYENPELNDIDKKEFLKELFEMKTSTEEELILKKSKILEALKNKPEK